LTDSAITDVSDAAVPVLPETPDGVFAVDRGVNRRRLWAMLLLSVIGLLASGMLAYDNWRSLVNPEQSLICSFDPAVDCGPAMSLWQAQIFGFPNAYLGIAAFSVAVTWAAGRLAGSHARWFNRGMLIGSVLGQLLIFFLMYTTFSQLPALCPWCTVIWLIMWPLLWLQIVEALEVGRGYSEIANEPTVTASPLVRHRWPILAAGYVLAFAIGLVTIGPRLMR